MYISSRLFSYLGAGVLPPSGKMPTILDGWWILGIQESPKCVHRPMSFGGQHRHPILPHGCGEAIFIVE